MNLAAGTTLAGHYLVIRRLGEGGMGGVYLVEDTHTGQRWALKQALDDPAASAEDREWAREHFEQEVALMRRLRRVAAQAGLAAYERDFTENGQRYLLMEYIPGESLEARIDSVKAPLPERDVVRWMADVCRAMETLHRQRPPIILRDMKPGNIMLPPTGGARVIDFGIARTYKAGQLSNTENLGTLAYASPEHHGQGQTDARSDVYSLGATMYHALTGREPQPLEEPTAGSLIHWNRALTPQTEAIVARAMRLDPAQRFQTAAEMRAALEERIAALEPRPRLTSPAPRAATTARQPVVTRPAPQVASPSPRAARVGSAASVAAGVVCPRCGHLNRTGARFCARDGAPLTPAAAHRVVSVQAAPATNVITTAGATHAMRATEAFAQGRYHQAIQQGQVALGHGHTGADLLLTLARSYEHVGRPLEAAEAFERVAQARPDTDALLAAAQAWRSVGRLDDAQVDLSKARQLAPDNAEASYLLGMVNLDLGHLAQAEGDLRDTLRLEPESARALIALGRLEEARGHVAEASDAFQRAAAADPASTEARWRLGATLLAQRRFSEAIRELEQSVRLDSTSADAYAALGMAYHATGRRQQARDALRHALVLVPGHREAQRLLKSL
ncbi:MAG TPA: tetratricopeptide repeat protein [Ktedonobacterales bacterium]